MAPFGRTAIRRFVDNASEMHQIGARDFEDLVQVITDSILYFIIAYSFVQCAIPCFEGRFPESDNKHVMRLCYTMSYCHSLAKIIMYMEGSVQLLDSAHTAMATHLRHFEQVVCPRYATKEIQKVYAKRVHAQSKIGTESSSSKPIAATTGERRTRVFSLAMVKTHLLDYYPRYIRIYGTLDFVSTLRVRVYFYV